MASASVDCSVIHRFLEILSSHTNQGYSHRFITTNWDYLLQREICNLKLRTLPSWLANSHVFHLNGTIEELPDNSRRSLFLLEEDSESIRSRTLEAEKAYSQMINDRKFIVVGMSFECDTDKFLLNALGRVKDDLPIGESRWIVINPDTNALKESCDRIASRLPHASIQRVCNTFENWMSNELPELQKHGVLSF